MRSIENLKMDYHRYASEFEDSIQQMWLCKTSHSFNLVIIPFTETVSYTITVCLTDYYIVSIEGHWFISNMVLCFPLSIKL